MIQLHCEVKRIIYQNKENGYSIMQVMIEGYNNFVTIVGCPLDVPVGSFLLCDGDWIEDKRFGTQFHVDTWQEVMPATINGIINYISSGLIKGIGPNLAKLIVEKFGTETIDILENKIERLYEVDGIGKIRFEKIKVNWEKQKEIKDIMLFLKEYDVSTAYAVKIYKQYGKDSIRKVKENPYRLADEIWGIGFKTADEIASKMGYGKNDFRRCKSGLIYTLNQLSVEGHVYAVEEQLVKSAKNLLDADEESLRIAMNELLICKELIQENDAIYLPSFYFSEVGTAIKIRELLKRPFQKNILPVDIQAIQKSSGIVYNEIQIKAIQQAVDSKVMVLTGGPGTGKTTTTQGIIAAFKNMGLKILLAAPTGRAAKRMSEATGMEAKTIHRLLEFNPDNGYKRNKDNQLEGDALIVDECSMIDINLMYNLMKAIPTNMRLVLVGDIDQLPSVGAGNVLRDIIDSGCVPVIRLTLIFRQSETSLIIKNAHAFNNGYVPIIENGKGSDFFFIEREDPEKVAEEIVSLVQMRLPNAYNQPISNIQVLTPMRRSVIGADKLNAILQNALNNSTQSISRGEYMFKTGDRVMQIRNNYDKDVFNGDIGFVYSINQEDKVLTVDYDGHFVEYEVSELEELTLAYATTIHKSQGSEYPIVVIPIMMKNYIMLQRNLVYTAITRAKKVCVLIGQSKALEYAVANQTITNRNTLLKERIKGNMLKL